MILSPALADKVAILVDTSDGLLPSFPPIERSVIIALKQMMKNKNKMDENGSDIFTIEWGEENVLYKNIVTVYTNALGGIK